MARSSRVKLSSTSANSTSQQAVPAGSATRPRVTIRPSSTKPNADQPK